jgi:urease accessory protein
MVGANLEVMKGDALRMRGTRPFVFSIMKGGQGAEQIGRFIIEKGGLANG